MTETPPPPADPTTPGPWIRQAFGPYVLRRKLAEGGMAEIFLARRSDGQDGAREVVIKRIRQALVGQPDFLEMLRQEGRLATQLVHSHLVRVYEQGSVEGRAYLCMEWLAGEDFSTLVRLASLRGEFMPVPLVLRVLADAARGLHYAHDFVDASGQPLNIVHRDVSPSNLYVTFEGQVKVLDFGVAQAGGAATRPGEMKGKVIYMAPEQALGGVVDRRADVFSLGVCLYEALTHVRPFARERDAAVLDALREGDFPRPRALRPELSPELEAVVLKAMAPAPARRHGSAAEFADALERLLSREYPPATPTHLAAYLRTSVGEERYREKTFVPPFDPSGKGGGSKVVRSPMVTDAPRRRSGPPGGWPPWAAGALALCLVGVGAVLVSRRASTPALSPVQETPSLAQVESGAPKPESLADAGTRSPLADPADKEAPRTRQAGRGSSRQASASGKGKVPASLEVADIQRVVTRNRASYLSCFERHKEDLRADEGEVRMRFTIQSSGRAETSTQGALAERPLGKCLEQRLNRLRFPAHRGDAVTVVLPLGYRVTR
ncbi:serine/threonine-protein kinase Pkn6 [Cystobacter fuscus]|uniref:Serine/threonine-protein kinase Pkn6 n=1 Tax=Cystobacter fuscus TaxID=43 RepID=A0A250IZ59_9BACT|nr:protein kinase [Cystobacter fuscus]ATB37014.1 serine/threonine-protein kinase Pkn6 [Cystobacter fuscus]